MVRQGINYSTRSVNPRFPHWAKVTRTITNTDVNPPTSTIIPVFEGECRNYPSRSGSTGMTDGVFVSDYTISLPFCEIDFRPMDLVEITDRTKKFSGVIVNSYNGNLGCVIWHNRVDN